MSVPARVLAARHRLLVEVGDDGVARLAASEASVRGLERDAAEVARTYLERSGVTVTGSSESESSEPIELAYLRGAHFALEHVARTVGLRDEREGDTLAVLLEAARAR